jgi:hypothetical protein
MSDDDDTGQPSDDVSSWLSKIEGARRDDHMAKYEERCHLIRKRYRYEDSALVRTRKYQLLWSNIQTMQSAIYAKPPHAVVSRRYRDPDPVARVATEVLERAINFTFDAADFDSEFKMVRDDFLLYARGVARIYYEPEYETGDDEIEDISDATDIRGLDGTPDYGAPGNQESSRGAGGNVAGSVGLASTGGDELRGVGEAPEDRGTRPARDGDEERKLKFENVRIRFVQRADFRHQPSRVWGECQWVAFRAFLTRDEISDRFGKKVGKEIAFDADPVGRDEDSARDGQSGTRSMVEKAVVWEIWDKAKRRVLWISPGYDDVLEEGDPYLELDGFYPCPRPAYGTLTPDSLVPVPDYVFYQDQAQEIDQLTARIAALNDMLKFVGFYPAGPSGEGVPEIEQACASGFENKMIGVQNWSAFLEGGQSKGAPIVTLPTDQIITVVQACVELRKQLVEDVYQIIGISDIMRGATDPQETEGAQQLKAQYGGTRIKDRQAEIARFCRDIARLVGQVIATYCSPETIMEMTNIKLPTRAQAMIAQVMAQRQQMAQVGTQPGQGVPQRPQVQPYAPSPPPPPPGVPAGLPAGPRTLMPMGGAR